MSKPLYKKQPITFWDGWIGSYVEVPGYKVLVWSDHDQRLRGVGGVWRDDARRPKGYKAAWYNTEGGQDPEDPWVYETREDAAEDLLRTHGLLDEPRKPRDEAA